MRPPVDLLLVDLFNFTRSIHLRLVVDVFDFIFTQLNHLDLQLVVDSFDFVFT
jgi:hypothetical protein